MPNVASITTCHNKKILGTTTPDTICNCRVKSQCPMDSKCQERSIIYKAVTSAETKKQYIGLTEHALKQRYSNHQTSFQLPCCTTCLREIGNESHAQTHLGPWTPITQVMIASRSAEILMSLEVTRTPEQTPTQFTSQRSS